MSDVDRLRKEYELTLPDAKEHTASRASQYQDAHRQYQQYQQYGAGGGFARHKWE